MLSALELPVSGSAIGSAVDNDGAACEGEPSELDATTGCSGSKGFDCCIGDSAADVTEVLVRAGEPAKGVTGAVEFVVASVADDDGISAGSAGLSCEVPLVVSVS